MPSHVLINPVPQHLQKHKRFMIVISKIHLLIN